MNPLPADPWRGGGGFLDTIREGALILDQIGALLASDAEGVDAVLRALEALSADDLRAAALAAGVERMLDANRCERDREELRRRWRRRSRFGRWRRGQ